MRAEIPSSERSQHWQSPNRQHFHYHLVWTHHQLWSHGWPNIFFCPDWEQKRTLTQDNNIGDLQHAVKWVIGQIDLSASPALNSQLALFAGFCFHLLIDLPCVGIAMCHVVDANTCLRSRELNTDIFRQTSPSIFKLSLHCIHHHRSVAKTVAGCVISKPQNRWTAGHSESDLLDLSWSLVDRKLWELQHLNQRVL